MEKLFSGKAWRLPTSNSVVNTAVEALDVARSSEQLAGHGLFGDFKIGLGPKPASTEVDRRLPILGRSVCNGGLG